MKKLFLLATILLGLTSQAQDGIPVYLDYLSDNYYLLHPSMAGAANCGKLRLTARQQWFDADEAPNLQTLSFNTALGEESRSGIGAILFNDRNGYTSQTGAYLSYAYHLPLSYDYGALNRLSFGINVGLVQNRLDERTFDLTDFDPVIGGILQSDSYFNADIGLSYFYENFYAHGTVKNLLFQNRDIFTEEFESPNQRRYIATIGYLFNFEGQFSKWGLEPSLLYHYVDRTEESFVDINLKGYYDLNEDTQLWGALSYRRSQDGAEFVDGGQINDQQLQLFSPILGVKYKQFIFGYTYSQQIGDIQFEGSGGFHQLTLGINFLCREERWHCDCPAVNN